MRNLIYTILFEFFKDEESEGYSVVVPALPEIITWGRTLDEARRNAVEAIQCHVEGLLKDGDPIPSN
ncbi:MAG: type II toxin-antitoxin system HicB family antitoxin [Candidatus Omnitrophica bacterium]|nr:hypothetical protein [bacterium]NUN97623.1 type II toxin-antitoxin system HicB family antitoxin [Candidatus Omnitrophota bacterium]